jgi:ribonuclease HII
MTYYIGIDEVGRGSWAGPLLVVAARQVAKLPDGLADSKQLSRQRRQALMPAIIESCHLGEGWVEAAEIDRLGLAAAMRLGVTRALTALRALEEEPIVMDGPVNYCDSKYTNVRCVVGADASFPIVSAASIYAKQLRDAHMVQQAELFADYGFASNVGYGTKAHLLALRQLGPCRLHRRSYKPVQAIEITRGRLA